MTKSIFAEKVLHLKGHSGSIYALHQAPDSSSIFSAGSDSYLAQWNLKTGESEGALAKIPGAVYSMQYLPVSGLLCTGQVSGAVHVLDVAQRKEIRLLQNHHAAVFSLAFSAKNNRFYSVSFDGSLMMCSLDDFTPIRKIQICKEKVRCLALSNDEQFIAVASGDAFIRIFDAETLKLISETKAHESSVNCLAFHPSGSFLLSGSRDAHLKIWNFKDGNLDLHQDIPAHNFALYDIKFMSGTPYFATASRDKTIKIWDTNNFEFLLRINKEKQDGHINSVNTLIWNEQEHLLVSAGDDRMVMAWRVKDGD